MEAKVDLVEQKEDKEKKAEIVNYFIPVKGIKDKLYLKDYPNYAIEVNTTIAKRVHYINIYWTYFYNNLESFRKYYELIINQDKYENKEEFKVELIKTFYQAIDDAKRLVLTYVDLNSWSDAKRKTKNSVFLDLKTAEQIVELLLTLIIGFPHVFSDKYGFVDFDIISEVINKYDKAIHSLLSLIYTKIKLDNIKDSAFLYHSLISNSTGLIINFISSLFSLCAFSSVFMPPEYEYVEKRILNFFGYFTTMLTENQKYIIKSYPAFEKIRSELVENLISKNISYDILDTLYSSLIIMRVNDKLKTLSRNIYSCYPTPLSYSINDILNISLDISESLLRKYVLLFQYVFYNIVKNSKYLRQEIGTGLELLRLGSRDNKYKKGNEYPILASILTKDIQYPDLVEKKVKNIAKTKFTTLVYLDDPNKEYTNSAINKQISDYLNFYFKVVLDEDENIINEIRNVFSKLDLNIRNKEDLNKIAQLQL